MAIDVEVITTALVMRLRGQGDVPAGLVPTIAEMHELLGISTHEGYTGKASSIFHARHLTAYRSPTNGTKFVVPFMAYREGSILQRERIIETPTYRIFIYDEPDYGYWNINQLVTLVRRVVCEPPLLVDSGALLVNVTVAGVSGATVDPTLSLATRYLTISMDATWL